MTAAELLRDLTAKGVRVTPNGDKLKLKAAAPLDAVTLELIRHHKPDLLRLLTGEQTIPRLPWQLESLLRAAASGLLPDGTVTLEAGQTHDLNRYVLAWAASYLIGDREHALKHLWAARRAWQQGEAN